MAEKQRNRFHGLVDTNIRSLPPRTMRSELERLYGHTAPPQEQSTDLYGRAAATPNQVQAGLDGRGIPQSSRPATRTEVEVVVFEKKAPYQGEIGEYFLQAEKEMLEEKKETA